MKRKTRKILFLIVISVCGAYLLFMGVYHASSASHFCATHHLLRGYTDSWRQSPHRDVNCLRCHEFRGFLGKLESKARGLNYVYLTVTNQFTVPTRARIFEQNCIGCHLGDYAEYQGVTGLPADHYALIKDSRSCLECHRETGHRENILLTRTFEKAWKAGQ